MSPASREPAAASPVAVVPNSVPIQADLKRSLGVRLHGLRTSRGLSLRQLAGEVGCSASALSQMESGISLPSVGLLVRIAAYLGASSDELLGLSVVRSGAPARSDDSWAESISLVSMVIEPGQFVADLPVTTLSISFVYVAAGDLTLELGQDRFVLGEGSSMQFRPARHAACSNRTSTPVRALWGTLLRAEDTSVPASRTTDPKGN